MSNRARRDYELLRRFPGFDSFPAAQNGRIYIVDASAYFARRGPGVVDSLEIPVSIVHPQEVFGVYRKRDNVNHPSCPFVIQERTRKSVFRLRPMPLHRAI